MQKITAKLSIRLFLLFIYARAYFVIDEIREKCILTGFKISQQLYDLFLPPSQVEIDLDVLITYPVDSLGYQYALFMKKNNFKPIPGHETHDFYHIIYGFDSGVIEEFKLQFYLYGAGKRSAYNYLTMLVALFSYPFSGQIFKQSIQKGKRFQVLSLKKLLANLDQPISKLSIYKN